jgi:cell division protein ZapE
MTGPREIYNRRLASGDLEADPAQEPAVAELDRLHDELVTAERRSRSLAGRIERLFGRQPKTVRGIYLWGSVGRGKTLLMDLFFHCLPFTAKKRQHFHHFMASVHDRLRRLEQSENPLDIVATQIAAECRIICFDEFAVSDIADAMILGNLFEALFERGVTLAATSNIEPSRLYEHGLQRQRFLPAIGAIEANTTIVHLDGEQDYRLRALERAAVYQSPGGTEAETHLARYFADIAPDNGEDDGSITVLGRPIAYRKQSDGVIWFDFDALCDGPRSQDDYIELARLFQTVIVSDVPQFDRTLENQARRFIALVDEFYDRKVKLILSAAVPLPELYAGQKLELEFERTRSRLLEMQSRDYLGSAHRP